MDLILYHNSNDENVIHKNLTEKSRTTIRLKTRTSVTNPIILLRDSGTLDLRNVNYCQLPDFKRFYFIRSIDSEENDVWRLTLECDVLESFKESILSSTAEISRPIQQGDYQSVSLDSLSIKEVDIHKSDVLLSDNPTMVLSTLGRGDVSGS